MPSLDVFEGGPLTGAAFEANQIAVCLQQVREPVHIVGTPNGGPRGLVLGSRVVGSGAAGCPQLGTLPPLYPEWLGDRDFGEVHAVRFHTWLVKWRGASPPRGW